MKERIEKVMAVLKRIKPHTYVSVIMLIIAILNYGLMAAGKPIINLGETEITFAVNMVLGVIFIVYGTWKNQSVTESAALADEVLYLLRDGKITKEELQEFVERHKSPETPTDEVKEVETEKEEL